MESWYGFWCPLKIYKYLNQLAVTFVLSSKRVYNLPCRSGLLDTSTYIIGGVVFNQLSRNCLCVMSMDVKGKPNTII